MAFVIERGLSGSGTGNRGQRDLGKGGDECKQNVLYTSMEL